MMKRHAKILVGIASFIFAAMLAYKLTTHKAEPVMFIIPDEYIGPVVMVLNQKNGSLIEYEGANRKYVIPKNGLLATRSNLNLGVHGSGDERFYYQSRDGIRRELDFVPLKWTAGYTKDLKDDELKRTVVFAYSVGTTTRQRTGEKVAFISFIVGPLDDSSKLNLKMSDLILSLTQ